MLVRDASYRAPEVKIDAGLGRRCVMLSVAPNRKVMTLMANSRVVTGIDSGQFR